MLRYFRSCLGILLVLLVPARLPLSAQAPDASTAPLREVHADGEKILTEARSSLSPADSGAQIGRVICRLPPTSSFEAAFHQSKFNFQTKLGAILVAYHVEESPRIPAYFDNIPWFSDSELADAIRRKFPSSTGRCRKPAPPWRMPLRL